MKKLPILLFAALGCSFGAAAQVSTSAGRKALEEKYGFRDARFETDTLATPGLVREFKSGPLLYFKRETESLKIGEAPLKYVSYGFFDNKLAAVNVRIEDYGAYKALDALQAAYGPGQKAQYESTYYWYSDRVRMMLRIKGDGSGFLEIESRPLAKAIAAAQKEAGKKAASDL